MFVSRCVILSVLMMASVFVLLCRCRFQSELAIGFYPGGGGVISLLMGRYGRPENFLRKPVLQVNFVPTAHTYAALQGSPLPRVWISPGEEYPTKLVIR